MIHKIGAGVVLAIWAVSVQAQVYQPQVPQFNEANSQKRLQNNPFKAIGMASMGENILPAYAVSVRSPVEEGWFSEDDACRPQACVLPVPAKVKAEHLNELMALRVAGVGWMLVPKTWRDMEADVGVNGSQAILIKSPDRRESLSYYHTGACVGCALISAAPFFPQAFKMAQSYEYAPQQPSPNIQLVRAQPDKVLFSYTLPNQYTTHGVAFWRVDDDEPFRDLRMTVHPSRTGLAGSILNAGVLAF